MGSIYKLVQRKRYYQCTQTISGVFVAQSLVFSTSIVFCKSLFVLFFGHCFVYPSSMYGFWLPLWYFQTFLTPKQHNNRENYGKSGTITKKITTKQHYSKANYAKKATQSEGKLCQNSTITEKIKIKQHNNKENYTKGQITDNIKAAQSQGNYTKQHNHKDTYTKSAQ